MTSAGVADDFRWSGSRSSSSSEAAVLLKETDVPRLRAVLNLTPEQQPHWVPVEAALIELARNDKTDTGIVQRASGVASKAMQLRRLKALAKPLIKSLDDTQKRDALAFARRMGYGKLVAAF
jgi:hypothetical protein